MVQLIKPHETKVVTKEGECQVAISLELTIKLDGDGLVVSSGGVSTQQAKEKDEVNWVVPDFSSGKKLNFGKEG